MTPRVTVLMPVYNGSPFLREAIDSILCQSYAGFELLLIDDGSTDDSASIVRAYSDARIRLVLNERNLGLIATLNKGIALAAGEYIARMDCDDVSLPERLEQQVRFLDENPSFAMVAVKAVFIDAGGKECGSWNDDQKYTSHEEIAGRLPRANCIVHPGVMIRKSVLKRCNGYDSRQRNSEDYDLWLRLVAEGEKIGKIDRNLLQYRLTASSVTALSNRRHPDFKNVRTKSIFVWSRLTLGSVNLFVVRVFLNIFKDLFYVVAKMVCPLPAGGAKLKR